MYLRACLSQRRLLGKVVSPLRYVPVAPFVLPTQAVAPVSVRSFSVIEMLRTKVADKMQDANEKKMNEQLKEMISSPNYSLGEFGKQVASGVNSWYSWVPGAKDKQEFKDAQKYQKILNAMKESELEDRSLIGYDVKRRIETETGIPVPEINLLLKGYDQNFAMYKWLKRRQESGKDMPQTYDELSIMIQEDRTGLDMKPFRPKQKSMKRKRK